MKKLMMTLAAALSATALMAEVKSVNVVGYTTLTVPATQWTMVGMPFADVGAGETPAGVLIQDLFVNPTNTFVAHASAPDSADQLWFWVWTGTAYDYRTMWLTSSTVTTRTGKWINRAGFTYPGDWGTANQPSTLKVTPGMSFWIKRTTFASPTNLTVAGQVVMTDTNAHAIAANGWTMLATSFAAEFEPNSTNYNWLTSGATAHASAPDSADQIWCWVWTGSAYDYRTMWLTSSTVTTRTGKWINRAGFTYPGEWGAANQPSTHKIPPGTGFWYKRVGTAYNFVELRPYAAN
jgi:hypothetical protein